MAEKLNECLIYAAEDGSMVGVLAALKAGADINCDVLSTPVTSTGTPLYQAVVNNRVDIVKFLLRQGASLTKRTKIGFSPLHAAAIKGWVELVDLLVQNGATLDVRDSHQMTPIFHACHYGHANAVRRLIDLGARVDLVNINNTSVLGTCKTESIADDCTKEAITKLVQDALETKQLRCCNPKCGKPGYRSDLKLCGGCRMTRYCSRECQKQHWLVGHKKCCGHDIYTGPPPNPVDVMGYTMVNLHKAMMCGAI